MIKCSILDSNFEGIERVLLYKEIKLRLEYMFENAFFGYCLYEKDFEVDYVEHIFPNSFIRYKDKKEIVNLILEIKDILTDGVVRTHLKPLYVYMLFMINNDFFELQREMIDIGDIKEEKLIPESIKKILSTNTSLSQDEKEDIEFWFTHGIESDICFYDKYNLYDDIGYCENQFEDLALYFLEGNELDDEELTSLLDGIIFIPKDMADMCMKKISAKNSVMNYPISNKNEARYNFFISYASEEIYIAQELMKQLQCLGARTWIDKEKIKIGDSIKQSIERGILNSEYAIIILSQNYINKYWTNTELNAFFELEADGYKRILPLIYNLSHEELKRQYILMSDKYYLSINEKNIEEIAKKIIDDTN